MPPLAERYETHKYEYTENMYNLRCSRDEFNDRVIEPQISVQAQIERFRPHRTAHSPAALQPRPATCQLQ